MSRLNELRLPHTPLGPLRDNWSWIVVTIAMVCVPSPSPARADLVKLLNGGELRGKILQTSDGKQKIRLETLTGATVVVDRDQTQFVTMRSLTVEEYETRARHVESTWEAHWELAEWCRQRGLTSQRETQLRRVTELNPDHEKAQQALGRVWHLGQWVDRDELMASQGYVKYKSKYVTQQELEVLEKTSDELQRERSWFSKVRLWHGWLDDNGARGRQGMNELRSITDPHAATAVIKFLGADGRAPVRELCVAVLIKISGNKAVAGLVKLALFDDSIEVREAALKGIGQDYFQHAQMVFVNALRNESNAVVCRSAKALEQIGDKKAVGPLIEALVTIHNYQVAMDVPNSQVYSFNTDGSLASGLTPLPADVIAAMRTGNSQPAIIVPYDPPPKKMVTIRVEHRNAEVLAALQKLTEKDFGYDVRTWNLWWAAEKNQGGKAVK